MDADITDRAGRTGDRLLKGLVLVVVIAGVAGLDLALRALGVAPPDDPLLFDSRTRSQSFSPFVESADGALEIRADWVSRGDGLEVTRGDRAGHFVLHPGFRAARLPVPKPADELRIFALGGSSTFGLYVGAEAAFPSVLGDRLGETLEGQRPRVVNLGCAGWASDRIAALLDAVLTLEPDLVIVYSGHNELLAGEAEAHPLDGAVELRAELLRRSVLFRWLDFAIAPHVRAGLAEERSEQAVAREASAFDPLSIPAEQRRLPRESWLEAVAQAYGANLRAMVTSAEAAGVPILFALPAANLVFPPMAAAHAEGFSAHAAFDSDVSQARAELQAEGGAAALPLLDRAVWASPHHASAHYWRALALADLGRGEQAVVELQLALDTDVRTHRITSRLEAAFVEAMRESGGRWVDVRPHLHASLSPESARALFIDHVLPTPEGHARIAEALESESLRLLAGEKWAASQRP